MQLVPDRIFIELRKPAEPDKPILPMPCKIFSPRSTALNSRRDNIHLRIYATGMARQTSKLKVVHSRQSIMNRKFRRGIARVMPRCGRRGFEHRCRTRAECSPMPVKPFQLATCLNDINKSMAQHGNRSRIFSSGKARQASPCHILPLGGTRLAILSYGQVGILIPDLRREVASHRICLV